MYRYPIFLLVAALFPACNHSGSQQDYAASEKTMTMEMPRTGEAPTPPGDQSAAPQPKIILTASMRCRVKDLERSTQSVRQAVEGMKGSITQMNWVHSQSSIENMLTIRIPSDKLDTLLERISREATYVHYRNLHSEDVTAEYVDIETRLRTKKEVRDRYIDIRRNKARTVTEVLDAEEKIRALQEEIEAQEGRLKYLSNQVALSTLTWNSTSPSPANRAGKRRIPFRQAGRGQPGQWVETAPEPDPRHHLPLAAVARRSGGGCCLEKM
ncbi:MAG: DUF4349 domain-containing protein [Haliscomenobacter sp.]|nr:DUF4349 domain-containing protein [Haliscomenobacter sp.]